MANERLPGLPSISIERATDGDAAAFVELHEEAARWLWERDIHQWKPGAFQVEWLRGPIERGEVYLVKEDGIPIATLILQWSDEYTWGTRPPDAGYIHGVRVRRAAAGRGIGRALLDWAEREIARAGRPYARLDCIAENPRLCAYYTDAGYARQPDLEVEGADKGRLARFEKRVLPHGDDEPGRTEADA
ncbi:MAG: GNAT family N-acetyltransferase [Ktedonobacterales bacterium]